MILDDGRPAIVIGRWGRKWYVAVDGGAELVEIKRGINQ